MKFFVLVVLLFVGVASSLRLSRPNIMPKVNNKMFPALRMAEYEPVPVDSTNVRNAAAVSSGIFGLIIGGPFLGITFAAAANYISKSDSDAGEALNGIGKSVVEAYNFINKINANYKVTDKIGETAKSLTTDSEGFDSVKKTVADTTSKFDELNKEYDLVTKGKEVIGTAANLSDTAIEKVIELNAKYDFVAVIKKFIDDILSKIKDSSK